MLDDLDHLSTRIAKLALQAQLQSRDQEVNALREATVQARQRIEAVLERLPGASQPEEPR
ncbi:MAG: hypothetical protein NTW89_03155 [Burkholderiales bacterium]|nr:hypothetical protein [Burkholderiales bacterium]